MNSTQHSMRRSRASFAKVWPDEGGRISLMIFWTVAAEKKSELVCSRSHVAANGALLRIAVIDVKPSRNTADTAKCGIM